MIGAVYRAQADAAEIEALAKRRLADEYDAAQQRGEVAGPGQYDRSNVPDQNVCPPTTADLGLSRKDIYEARIIRDAEANDPGVVRRTLDQRIEQGAEPSKAALREAVIAAAMRGLRGGGRPRLRSVRCVCGPPHPLRILRETAFLPAPSGRETDAMERVRPDFERR